MCLSRIFQRGEYRLALLPAAKMPLGFPNLVLVKKDCVFGAELAK
jgi:hypothetical protein